MLLSMILCKREAYIFVTGWWLWEEIDVQKPIMLLLNPVHKLFRHIDLVRIRENCVCKYSRGLTM
jgi:hypothetical protein